MAHDPSAVYSSGAFNYSNSSIVPLEKTIYVLRAGGEAKSVTHRELIHTDSGGITSSTDNVVTYTYHFYDSSNRLETTAHYGTNQSGWTVSGTDPNPSSAPSRSATVLVTGYAYDTASRISTVTDPRNLVARYTYDDLSRVTKVEEDDGGGDERETQYTYDSLGNVATITAVQSGGASNQTTQYTRGHTGNTPIDPNWVTKIAYPNPSTGAAGTATADTVELTYNRDGTLATRREQRNATLTFDYDGRRRLQYQRLTSVGGVADTSVRLVGYTYSNAGHLTKVTQTDNATAGSGTVLNEVQFDYDGYGQVTKDWQAHAGVVTTSGGSPSPYVGYTYEHSSSTDEDLTSSGKQNFFERIQQVRYPNTRIAWLDYDDHSRTGLGAMNHLLSRPGRLADGSTSPTKYFAEYDFNGIDHMVQRNHLDAGSGTPGKPGNKTALRFYEQPNPANDPSYIGFDRFGRYIDLVHNNYNGTTVDSSGASKAIEFKHGYDENSNRRYSEALHNKARSRVFAYDRLDRLTNEKLGLFNGNTSSPDLTDEWNKPVEDAWTLDKLGNWSTFDRKRSGTAAAETRAHNATNEITSRTYVTQAKLEWVNDNFADGDTTNWELGTGDNGAWSISSGQLANTSLATAGTYSPPGGGSGSVFLMAGQYQDIRLSASVILSDVSNDGGLVFGYVDKQNFWVLRANRSTTKYELYQVTSGTWTLRASSNSGQISGSGGTYTLTGEIRSGSICSMTAITDTDGTIPAGRIGFWAGSASSTVKFDNYVVRSLAANLVVDGRFSDDVGDVTHNSTSGKLEYSGSSGLTRRTVLRHVRQSTGIIQVDMTYVQGSGAGIILNYQDPENFGVVEFVDTQSDPEGPIDGAVARYVEFKDGKKKAVRATGSGFGALNTGSTYAVRCVVTSSGGAQTLTVYVAGSVRLNATPTIDDTWSGGSVGLFRGTSTATGTVGWDNFMCGTDGNADNDLGTIASPDSADAIYAAYNFTGTGWPTVAFTHDDAGNLTSDGLFEYQYDGWNRLAGVWYAGGDLSSSSERVAKYDYDGLFRRVKKTVTNRGSGPVYGSDASMTGIEAGDRTDHFYYASWRVVELRNGNYQTLGQFVYGTQYIDEPVCYDRNTDVTQNNDCLDSGSKRYFYHQDANYRVVALTAEDGTIVERYEYDAYGEPTVLGGSTASSTAELGNTRYVSIVGNPLMHQGLWRDADSVSYQNRYRQYSGRIGRFAQLDLNTPRCAFSFVEYLCSTPLLQVDPFGLSPQESTSRPARAAPESRILKASTTKVADACKGQRTITRTELEGLIPGAKTNPSAIEELDRGCVGVCAVLQPHYSARHPVTNKRFNGPEGFPEKTLHTRCFNTLSKALCATCDSGNETFIFQVRGRFVDGRRPEVDENGQLSDNDVIDKGQRWDYATMVRLPEKKQCWINGTGAVTSKDDKGRADQRFGIQPRPFDDGGAYPDSIWCATCP